MSSWQWNSLSSGRNREFYRLFVPQQDIQPNPWSEGALINKNYLIFASRAEDGQQHALFME